MSKRDPAAGMVVWKGPPAPGKWGHATLRTGTLSTMTVVVHERTVRAICRAIRYAVSRDRAKRKGGRGKASPPGV